MVLFNAAAAFVAAGRAEDLNSGIKLGEEVIDSGKALDKLDKLIEFTQGF